LQEIGKQSGSNNPVQTFSLNHASLQSSEEFSCKIIKIQFNKIHQITHVACVRLCLSFALKIAANKMRISIKSSDFFIQRISITNISADVESSATIVGGNFIFMR
jgi:hypothetical protein